MSGKIFLGILICLFFTPIENTKEIEKCLMESLNPTDPEYKYIFDVAKLNMAILDYMLLPKELQLRFKECKAEKEGLNECEDNYGKDNCEQCGMIYIQKCPEGFNRLDCFICARACPDDTMEDALGALCAKPKIQKKKIYQNMLDCKKDGNEDCLNFG